MANRREAEARDPVERAGQPWRLPQRRQNRALAERERPQLTQAWMAGVPGRMAADGPGAARTSWLDAAQTLVGSGLAVARRDAQGAAADPGSGPTCVDPGSAVGHAGASGQLAGGVTGVSGATTRHVGCSIASAGAGVSAGAAGGAGTGGAAGSG